MNYTEVHFGTDNFEEFDYYDYRYSNINNIIVSDLDVPIKITQDWKLGKGGSLWDCSYILAKYLETLDLENKNVIELGAGTALPSIYCATKRSNVTITDLSGILPLIQHNVQINEDKIAGNVTVKELNWSNPSHRDEVSRIHWDYIILSDVFYLPVTFIQSIAKDFGETLSSLVNPNSQILLSYKYRVAHTIEPYLSQLSIYDQESLDDWKSTIHPNKKMHLSRLYLKKNTN
jgi:predicted nicotinamide N-methyase